MSMQVDIILDVKDNHRLRLGSTEVRFGYINIILTMMNY